MADLQFFFKWVAPDDTEFDPVAHATVTDEDIFSFEISQEEGDFANLNIEIENPRIGILNPTRQYWAHLSVSVDGDEAIPLFFGRVLGLPDTMLDDFVSLSLIARPADFQDQKEELAETLRVAPYFDPIWFKPESVLDPDNVLESRSALWHIDRVTHAVTISDIITGEDGVLAISQDDAFYDALQIGFESSPLRRVNVLATVQWQQYATGVFDVAPYLFGKGKKTVPMFGYDTVVSGYTVFGAIEELPKLGANIGGGWTVTQVDAKRIDSTFPNAWKYYQAWGTPLDGPDIIKPPKVNEPPNNFATVVAPYEVAGNRGGLSASFLPEHVLHVARQTWSVKIVLGYEGSRARSETLAFSVIADTQNIMTESDDGQSEDIILDSGEIGVDSGFGLAIGTLKRRSYFVHPRGDESIQYLLMLARARLLARARAVSINTVVPFEYALVNEVSLRKSAAISDPRIPGTIATGKIKSYALRYSSDSGSGECALAIACTVGRDGDIAETLGTPDVWEEDVVEATVQTHTGSVVTPTPEADIGYASISGQRFGEDDGIDFEFGDPEQWLDDGARGRYTGRTNEEEEQAMIGPPAGNYGLSARPFGKATPQDTFDALNDETQAPKWRVGLKPLNVGPFHTDIPLNVSDFKIPKTIDLEAGSAP